MEKPERFFVRAFFNTINPKNHKTLALVAKDTYWRYLCQPIIDVDEICRRFRKK